MRVFHGRPFRKASFSGSSGGNCVYLPATGRLDAVVDSKTGQVLDVNATDLVALAKRI